MDRAQQLKALALAAKRDQKIKQAQQYAAAKRVSIDRSELEMLVLSAALAGDSSAQFQSLDVLAVSCFREFGFDLSITSRDGSEISGEIAWEFKRRGDTSLSEFDVNFAGWLVTSEGRHFSQRLFDALENAASLGRSGAKFSIESVSDGFLIGGKTKSPSPTLVGKILNNQGFRYELIDLQGERIELRVYWL